MVPIQRYNNMKIYMLFFALLITALATAQNNHIVKTDSGRRVLLKADFTWEYIDASQTATANAKPTDSRCHLPENFEEPKLDKKIQSQLKKGRATMEHVKRKVAKEYQCDVKDITLIEVSEIKTKGQYGFCVKGKEVVYKRIGNSIIKKKKLF